MILTEWKEVQEHRIKRKAPTRTVEQILLILQTIADQQWEAFNTEVVYDSIQDWYLQKYYKVHELTIISLVFYPPKETSGIFAQ